MTDSDKSGLTRPRLRGEADPAFKEFDSSIRFDFRLAPYDIAQSKAHVSMLASAGIMSPEERDQLVSGLDEVSAEFDEDRFEYSAEDEDIHMAIERRVTEIVGPVGGELHTARSRNDQVATDLAMFVRAHALGTQDKLRDLMQVLLDLAERHIDWPMPGYTHLQRAQPVYLSHHVLAYFWMFRRDLQRFNTVLNATTDLPLGVGALAGVNWETNRMAVAQELGFTGIADNSIDAVSNRDFVLDFLAGAATCATHLSRLGAELVLWSSDEFGFCELDDSFTSGSSLMPQKKNPDAAELLRAKAPRVVSHLAALHGVLHGLPLAYNKDLQEDKEHAFDVADTIYMSLAAATGMLKGIKFNRERLAAAAADEFLASTDVADLLVRKGVPFREAHTIVGALVRYALDAGKKLSELSGEELQQFSSHLDPEFYELFEERGSQETKISDGGTAQVKILDQIAEAKHVLE